MSLALHKQLIRSSSSTTVLWKALTRIFGTQTIVKAMRYRSLLQHFKKNNLSMLVYLTVIKNLCDSLAGCGHHVSLKEQQSTILNGLLPEFDHVVSIITTSQVLLKPTRLLHHLFCHTLVNHHDRCFDLNNRMAHFMVVVKGGLVVIACSVRFAVNWVT